MVGARLHVCARMFAGMFASSTFVLLQAFFGAAPTWPKVGCIASVHHASALSRRLHDSDCLVVCRYACVSMGRRGVRGCGQWYALACGATHACMPTCLTHVDLLARANMSLPHTPTEMHTRPHHHTDMHLSCTLSLSPPPPPACPPPPPGPSRPPSPPGMHAGHQHRQHGHRMRRGTRDRALCREHIGRHSLRPGHLAGVLWGAHHGWVGGCMGSANQFVRGEWNGMEWGQTGEAAPRCRSVPACIP